MGVEEDTEFVGSSSQVQTNEEEITIESLAALEIEMDTIVLPEGVCLFDKPFVITERDPDGKKFDKVSRFICRCPSVALELLIDINIEVYPVKVGAHLQVMVTTTLKYDGSQMPATYTHAIYKEQSLMDEFEYVTYGKVFKIKDTADSKLQVFVSFGGLIVRFLGDPSALEKFQTDQRVFMLIRHLKSPSQKSKAKKRSLGVI